MRLRHWITASILILLAGAALAGLLWTREPAPVPEGSSGAAPAAKAGKAAKGGTPQRRERRVDMRPLETARNVGALAQTREEVELAREAERLANHAVDLAFALALREAAESAPEPTPAIKALAEAKAQAEELVDNGQRHIKRLTQQLATAREQEKDALEDQLDVAKAQLELDQDELEAASGDLERAGGDPQAWIRRLKEAHDAVERQGSPQVASAAPAAPPSRFQPGSLVGRLRAWTSQRAKLRLLEQARQEALEKVQRLGKRRETLGRRIKEAEETRQAAEAKARELARKGRGETASHAEARETLANLKRFTADQRALTAVAKRILDEQELAEVYGSWITLAQGYERTALHALLKGLVPVLSILAVAFLLNRLIEILFHGMAQEKLRASTLRSVLKFAVRFLAALIILFVAVGLPSQATTILGLAGAGLTVALKDFIVAFFGWFVLMGRNGIRVGDWVEIKGVGGEVVEVGLLRTVLLETGSWNDSGHPTGRRVAFVNSFAMEGHYFNFTTSGQWMWDELSALIPPGQDPYPIIDGVQRLVDEETEANAREAEAEWSKATRRYRVQAFSATPGIQVVPTANGVEMRVRYITRAFERHGTRRRLYQAVVGLMHPKKEACGEDTDQA